MRPGPFLTDQHQQILAPERLQRYQSEESSIGRRSNGVYRRRSPGDRPLLVVVVASGRAPGADVLFRSRVPRGLSVRQAGMPGARREHARDDRPGSATGVLGAARDCRSSSSQPTATWPPAVACSPPGHSTSWKNRSTMPCSWNTSRGRWPATPNRIKRARQLDCPAHWASTVRERGGRRRFRSLGGGSCREPSGGASR